MWCSGSTVGKLAVVTCQSDKRVKISHGADTRHSVKERNVRRPQSFSSSKVNKKTERKTRRPQFEPWLTIEGRNKVLPLCSFSRYLMQLLVQLTSWVFSEINKRLSLHLFSLVFNVLIWRFVCFCPQTVDRWFKKIKKKRYKEIQMMQKKGSYSNYDGKEFGRILEFCPIVLPHSPHADITSEHEIHLELFLGL